MKQKEIISIGIDLPGADFEYIPFHTRRSLLGADLVIFSPGLDLADMTAETIRDGKQQLSQAGADRNRDSIAHWHGELQGYLASGGQVLVFLAAPCEACAVDPHTGITTAVHSYDALPFVFRALIPATGTLMKLAPGADYLSPWWGTCSAYLKYEVGFQVDGLLTVVSEFGEQVVGAEVKCSQGTLLLLPTLDLENDQLVYYDGESREFYWTDTALRFGEELYGAFIEIGATLRGRASGKERAMSELTKAMQPVGIPQWVAEERYRLQSESMALAAIGSSQTLIAELLAQVSLLQQQVIEQEQRLPVACRFKRLLYETGPELNAAVSEALLLLGFEPGNEEEFEFVVDDARLLVEVTGSSEESMDFDRVLRLERSIQNDFSRDGVANYARGALFANPFCRVPPTEREHLFTEKALAAAKRFGFILVHTPDLYRVIQYLEGAEDRAFREQVRKAFFASSGAVVTFPALPETASQ